MSWLQEAVIFLGAAVVAVPLAKRSGFGAVLGYLVAGIAIGPWGLRLITDVESILHFGEFGVVLLLFIIGLELQPKRLWVMRRPLFVIGGAQVALTTALLAAAAFAAGLSAASAIVVGFALSLSSTAFALQMLAEKKQLTTRHGRAAFAILLFQDLAVIPALALIPLLGDAGSAADASTLWPAVAEAVVAVAVIVVGGHFLLRPVFRLVSTTGIHEVFTATALLVVVGTALLMASVGLSMALGAFLAGVLLADSEYRHALEADIDAFKALLLGLFFIAVGMSVNVGLIGAEPVLVVGLVLGLVAVKFSVLFVLARMNGLAAGPALSVASVLPQGGEFAFVIFGAAVAVGLMDPVHSDLLILVVTLSMAVTPLLFALNDAVQGMMRKAPAPEYEHVEEEDNPVIIAGFGRFGQIVARILRAKRIGFTALEYSSEQVDFVRRYGNKVYYGDASRLDLLRAAGIDKAKIFVLAIDEVAASLRTAELVRKHFPNLKILARARNRKHAYQLMDLGVTAIWRETLLSSLDLARAVLLGLGLSKAETERAVNTFRGHDEKRLVDHHAMHNDEERMVYLAQEAASELEQLFAEDAVENGAERHDGE